MPQEENLDKKKITTERVCMKTNFITNSNKTINNNHFEQRNETNT